VANEGRKLRRNNTVTSGSYCDGKVYGKLQAKQTFVYVATKSKHDLMLVKMSMKTQRWLQ